MVARPRSIRAYASYDAESLDAQRQWASDQVGNGYFAILIDQGQAMHPLSRVSPRLPAPLFRPVRRPILRSLSKFRPGFLWRLDVLAGGGWRRVAGARAG